MADRDDSGTAAEFLAVLGRTLGARGWRAGEPVVIELPPRTEPLPARVVQRFDRPVDDGWVARLTISWSPGTSFDLLRAKANVRHYVHVEGAATLPAAEDLARRCGSGGNLAIDSSAEFSAPRNDPGERRIRSPRDYDAAVGEIAGYAEHALMPWAREHGTLGHWLAEWDEDPFEDACAVSVMLAAHGRGDDALARLAAAQRDPRAADDPELEPLMARLTAFVATGVLPDPLPEDPPPVQDPDRYVKDRTAEDPIRKEFYGGFNAELGEEPLGAQWRYFGRQLRSAVRMVRAIGGDDPRALTWWAPVAVGVEVEALLDRMYAAAGPPVDHRVGLQVELGGRGSGPDDGVEVRIGGDVVGTLRSADIPTWGTVPCLDGVRRARLRRKRERPRFLLEVDIG